MFIKKLTNFFRPWWKLTKLEGGLYNGFKIEADPSAWSKWIFILWRFQHKWLLLEVPEFSGQYKMYFIDEDGMVMRYRKFVTTKVAGVRVSNKNLKFIAISSINNKEVHLNINSNESLNWLEVRKFRNQEKDLITLI